MERDPTTVFVTKNIESIMLARGLDPAKLGRASGLNATGIYDILSGKSRSPKVETLAKIADGLGVPIAVLFEEDPDLSIRADILAIFDQLPQEQRELLLRTAQAWSSEVA